ncbi:MAG TPA: LysR family transcriptional regulator [Candidatus Omnitrophota bacterium]|nr:LysR family transcriptional regulator [Candidatus Omnitrophota bacterium]
MYEKLFEKTGLSLERLRSFCLVAEQGGFNKAAGKHPYRQAQFSKQVADLEKYFGFSLFVRKGRSITLSPNGKALYLTASNYLAELERLLTKTETQSIPLSISAGESVINYVIPSLLDEDIQKMSHSITLIDRTSPESLEDILSYKSDLAIVGRSIKDKRIICVRLIRSNTVLITSKKYPKKFYTGDNIKLLSENPTVLLSGKGSYRQTILSTFGKQNPKLVLEAPSFAAVKTYVAAGMGVSYIPQYCFTPTDANILDTCIPAPFKSAIRELFLIYRKNLPDLSQTAGKIISQILKKFPSTLSK